MCRASLQNELKKALGEGYIEWRWNGSFFCVCVCFIKEKDIGHHQCLTLSVQNSVISVRLLPRAWLLKHCNFVPLFRFDIEIVPTNGPSLPLTNHLQASDRSHFIVCQLQNRFNLSSLEF